MCRYCRLAWANVSSPTIPSHVCLVLCILGWFAGAEDGSTAGFIVLPPQYTLTTGQLMQALLHCDPEFRLVRAGRIGPPPYHTTTTTHLFIVPNRSSFGRSIVFLSLAMPHTATQCRCSIPCGCDFWQSPRPENGCPCLCVCDRWPWSWCAAYPAAQLCPVGKSCSAFACSCTEL